MTLIQVVFYVFAFMAAASAVAVISAQNPVRSVLSLVVTFFAMSGIWMLLHAEFLSLVLLLVYVGAVMTLFLFVVMMLNIDREQKSGGFVRYWPYAVIILVLFVALIFTAVGARTFGSLNYPDLNAVPLDYSNLKVLGTSLFGNFVYPFEVSGVILLSAMVAAISLTHRTPLRGRRQNIDKQVSVRPEDRLKLVKMPPSKPANSQDNAT